MMRHADSEESGEGRDHDRPITEAGRRAAQQARQGFVHEVLMSDSERGMRGLTLPLLAEACLHSGNCDAVHRSSLHGQPLYNSSWQSSKTDTACAI